MRWCRGRKTLVVLGVAAAVFAAATAHAGAVVLGPGSELWIEGTSTMHDFTCRSKAVVLDASIDTVATDARGLQALIRALGVHGLKLRVPVASLRSEKEGLDKNLRKTMEAERHPNVDFTLARYTCKAAGGDTLALHGAGALAIHGVTHEQGLDAVAWPGDGGVWLQGSQVLRMSEFGITPPTMMLGALKVRDPITVHYRLLLVPVAANAPAGVVR